MILKKDGALLCIDKFKKIRKFTLNSNEIEEITKLLNTDIIKESTSKIFKKLISKKILIKNENRKNYELYLNQFLETNIDIEKLHNKKIAIIGLGGLGTEILNHLLGVEIKNYILIDFDKVNESNLNRQYAFNQKDIGKYKVDVIENLINNKIGNANILKYNSKITNALDLIEILKNNSVDIIICAADIPFLDIRIAIVQVSIELEVPCIFGGVNVIEGQYGPLLIKKKNKKRYLEELLKYKQFVKSNNTNKASFGPTNTLIAAYMAKDIIINLLDCNKRKISSSHKIIIVNFESGKIYESKQF